MNNANPRGSSFSVNSHNRVSGLSGNEIYCLNRLGMRSGNLCVGNSVFSLGVLGSLFSGLKILTGGEISEITDLIHEGRQKAYDRLIAEARQHGIEMLIGEQGLHGGEHRRTDGGHAFGSKQLDRGIEVGIVVGGLLH